MARPQPLVGTVGSPEGSIPRPGGPSIRGAGGALARANQPVGWIFILSLVWVLFDIGRPPTPAGIPLLISAGMFLHWLTLKDKQWAKHTPWWFALLAVVALSLPFAANTYEVYFATRFFATLILMVCLPMQAMVNSIRRTRLWILSMVGVAFYVGAWAVSHGGFGPSASNGQDENYVATLMGMGVALAYFAMFAERKLLPKLLLGFAMMVFVAAMAVANNPSRGGFLGLIAVALYSLWRSPRKLLGLGVLGVAGVAMALMAGPAFWKEIETTADYQEGTSDVRIEIWKAGVRMWAANPAFGVGAGNFRWVIGDYQTADQLEKFGRSLGGSIIAHSTPVELLAELGTAGVIVVGALLIYTWRGLGRIRYKKPGPGQPPVHPDLLRLSCYADGVRACLLAILVSGIFLSLLYYSHLWVILAIGTALPFVHDRIVAQQANPVAPAQPVVPRRSPDFKVEQMLAQPAPGRLAPPPPRRNA
jgi:O-antigen ligase